MIDAPAPSQIGPRVIAVLLTALGINALVQVPEFLPSWGGEPALLSAQQAACAVAGIAAGVGAWRARPWAWVAALAYGVLTCLMIVSLGPLLDLDAAARKALPAGGGVVLVLCAVFAWYLRRRTRA